MSPFFQVTEVWLALWIFAPSVVTMLRWHREPVAILLRLGLPEPLVGMVLGGANLGWLDVAYAVGGGLKSVPLFSHLPDGMAILGVLVGVIFVVHRSWWRGAVMLYLTISVLFLTAGLLVLFWRTIRGMPDDFRIPVLATQWMLLVAAELMVLRQVFKG